jgi:NitT/TauT family transport system substrate-binding protein
MATTIGSVPRMAVVVTALALATTFSSAAGAQAARAKVFGVSALPVGTPSIPVYWIGKALGYQDQENLDGQMEGLPGGNVAQGAQMVVAGRADVVVQLFEGVVVPVSQNKDPGLTFVYCVYQHATFRMLVPANSGITSVTQLKGKRIGIAASGLPVEPLLKAYLAPSGVKPEDMAAIDVVGLSSPAAEALKNGRIAALFTASVTEGQYKGAGYDFVALRAPDAFTGLIGASAAVRRDVLKDAAKRDALVRFFRVWAKSSAFALANPAAATKLNYQLFPETKPKRVSEAAAIEAGVTAIKVGAQDWGVKRDGKWGKFPDDAVTNVANYLGVKVPDPKLLYTNELIDEINNFDEAAVIKQAKEFR